jgi:biopolymer transport protein TolR
MQLSARDRRRLQRALKNRMESDPSQGGELNIIPFLDITVNLMLFLLVTTAVTLTTVEVRARLPIHGRRTGREAPSRLSATITGRGTILATDRGFVGVGCEGTGRGGTVAIPGSSDHPVDVARLRACASALHAAMPEVDEVVLSADPEVAYEEVIRAMDALRADGEEPLFPRVLISGGVR